MTKPAILFIHGFPLDLEMWQRQLTLSRRWAFMSLNLRGSWPNHAEPTSPECSVVEHAANVMRVLEESDEEEVVVCGLSMGGYVLLEVLRSFPERVRAAILCNTKAAADTPEAKRSRDELAAKVEREGMEAAVAELVPKMLARRTLERRPAVVRKVKAMIRRQPVHGVTRALRALRDRRDSTPLLANIRIPVLVIAGDDDRITPASGMEQMARAIPGAEFVVIPDAGHLTPMEHPKAFNAAVSRFVSRL